MARSSNIGLLNVIIMIASVMQPIWHKSQIFKYQIHELLHLRDGPQNLVESRNWSFCNIVWFHPAAAHHVISHPGPFWHCLVPVCSPVHSTTIHDNSQPHWLQKCQWKHTNVFTTGMCTGDGNQVLTTSLPSNMLWALCWTSWWYACSGIKLQNKVWASVS